MLSTQLGIHSMSACLQTYLLKLQKSGEDGFKTFLVLESGQRFHTTQV